MQQRLSAVRLILLALFLAALCSACGREAAEKPAAKQGLSQQELGRYGHGIAVKDLRFLWSLGKDSIDVKLAAPTNGWVGIGFNPDVPENMEGASFIIGYVKGGVAEAFDHYGNAKNKHKADQEIGGERNLSNVSGSELDGQTVLEFTVPLDSGDPKDKPLDVSGDTIVLLAYGRSDSIVLKHRFRAILRVNLSTGDYSILKMQ